METARMSFSHVGPLKPLLRDYYDLTSDHTQRLQSVKANGKFSSLHATSQTPMSCPEDLKSIVKNCKVPPPQWNEGEAFESLQAYSYTADFRIYFLPSKISFLRIQTVILIILCRTLCGNVRKAHRDVSNVWLLKLYCSLQKDFGISFVYAWHSLHGYWAGISAESPSMMQYGVKIVTPTPSPGKSLRL